MSDSPSPARRRWPWPVVVALVGLVAVLVAFPPFRVVSRQARASEAAAAQVSAFDAVAFTRDFWSARLLPAARQAPELAPVLADLRRDPLAATQRHARRVGLGNAAFYFLQGTGRVVAVERSRVVVETGGALVALRTGPVFGNVVRDGCGLLEVNQVPGLAEFNALSAELNRAVEELVQPALRSVPPAIGATLHFAGCAEAPETLPTDGAPLLTFVPLLVEVKP